MSSGNVTGIFNAAARARIRAMASEGEEISDELNNPEPASPLMRGEGVNSAERYLKALCEKSFLRLWSYPGLYRDQGRGGRGGDGKEICDLLVVFDQHIIIFSSKNIGFGDENNENSWKRWYRRAIQAGAKQVHGAEKRIRNHPDLIFLDRACTRPFPYKLPNTAEARIHRIVVAHGASAACRNQMGGSGSLMLFPLLGASSAMPFSIGDLDETKGFVHVLDDTSLQEVMKQCDTVTDFVCYLTKKEEFIRAGKLLSAAGEEELLAHYLINLNDAGEHDFVIPSDTGATSIVLDEGLYAAYLRNPQYQRKLAADRASYAWDRLIEKFSGHAMQGTLYDTPDGSIQYIEPGLRLLAREKRVRRRALATALLSFLQAAGKDKQRFRKARFIETDFPGAPHYVFLTLRIPEGVSHDDYRQGRRQLLIEYCRVVRLIRDNARTVIGLAFNPPGEGVSSEDILVYDGSQFDDEERNAALLAQEELHLLKDLNQSAINTKEYPDDKSSAARRLVDPTVFPYTGTGRNEKCPCKSGHKYKKCCQP